MHQEPKKMPRTEEDKKKDEDEGRAAYARGVAAIRTILVVLLVAACGGGTAQGDAGDVTRDAGADVLEHDASRRCINDATGGLCDAGEVLADAGHDAGHEIADSCAPDGAHVFDAGDAGCYVYSEPTGGQCFVPCESQ